jgi:hypothetical protein
MVGAFIEWIAQPIEGPITDIVGGTLRLVYQRGLFDGFVAGVLVTLLVTISRRRCDRS